MLLGSGHMGEVFAVNDNVVAKLFYHHVSLDVAQYEVDMTRCAKLSSINVVEAGDIFEHEGRFGAYFERVHGISLLDACLKEPWKLFFYAKKFAQTHKAFHATKITTGRSQKEELKLKINSIDGISNDEKLIVLGKLEVLESGSSLCHGDYHLNNILKSRDDLIVIDWGGAMSGNPIADVAHTAMLLRLGELPRDASLLTRLCAMVFRRLFSLLYVHYYFKGQRPKISEYKNWLLPIAVARLASNNEPEFKKLHKLISKELKKARM